MAEAEKFVNYTTGSPTTLSNAVNSVFGASGATAAIGLVPVPSSIAGTTNFLREDGTWAAAGTTTVFTSTTSGLVPNPASAPAEYVLGPLATWNQPTGDQLLGTQTNDSATAGNVGEYVSISTTVLVSLTVSTPTPIFSVALGAGDWDINGTVNFTCSLSTKAINYNAMCIASTSNTFNQTNGFYAQQCYADTLTGIRSGTPYNNIGAGPLGSSGHGIVTLYAGCTRVSVSSCTSYFLLGQSSDLGQIFGILQARRVR